MKNGFAKRIISMMMVVCMVLTMCPVNGLAANEGTPSTITAGKLVADHYGDDLSREEKDLIGSGLLAGDTYEYYVPGDKTVEIQVDTETKTVTAEPWTDNEGNDWNPVSADIVVGGTTVESITLVDGEGTYTEDVGNAFSVQVTYEMYRSVDTDVQKQLLNTAGWLKKGIANLNDIAAQNE